MEPRGYVSVSGDAHRCATCGERWGDGLLSRTRGHLRPRSPDWRGRTRGWVWQCARCNRDQGQLSLRDWAAALRDSARTRWDVGRVETVARLLVELTGRGLWEHCGVKLPSEEDRACPD